MLPFHRKEQIGMTATDYFFRQGQTMPTAFNDSDSFSLSTAQRMLQRLLTEALPPYTVSGLACACQVSEKELQTLMAASRQAAVAALLKRLALPLIKVYCRTPFPEYAAAAAHSPLPRRKS